jgi:putative acetyltransferase
MQPERKIALADGFLLRRATNADVPAVWGLISTILRSYGITANDQTTDKDLTDLEANYWDLGGEFFVLVHGAETIGTVALHRESGSCCELCRMYLAQSYRGRGLGRKMLEACLREAQERGYSEARLKTASVLVEAIALYKQAGFTVVEGAKTCANCDLVMRRSLAG